MRCPNPVCREVFEVQDAEPAASQASNTAGEPVVTPLEAWPGDSVLPQDDLVNPPSGTTQTTGSVGDLVPILDAEIVHEVPPPEPAGETLPLAVELQDFKPVKPEEGDDAKPIPVDDSLRPLTIEGKDLVPLEPGARPVQEEAPWWHLPPPVRNPDAAKARARPPAVPAPFTSVPTEMPAEQQPPPARKSRSSPRPMPAVSQNPPEEARPSWHSAPPIRRRGTQPSPESEPPDTGQSLEALGSQTVPPEPIFDTGTGPSRTSRRALWIIGTMVVVAGFIVATVTVTVLNTFVRTEAKLYDQAKRDYDEGKYASAANAYQNLIRDFPNSQNQSLYQLLAELSQVRDQVYAAQADPGEALATTHRFLEVHKSNPLLTTYRADIWQTLGKLAEQLTASAQEKHDPALLDQAKESLNQSERYRPPGHAENRAAREQIAQAEVLVAKWQKKQRLLERLGRWLSDAPSLETAKEARAFAKRAGLEHDSEISKGILAIEAASRLRVRYVANATGTAKVAPEAIEPSLLVVPPVIRPPKPSGDGKHVVLALARGVLYALDQSTGDELWATRVGIDTATLPVRLPATPASPELFLVLSADRNTLMALEPLTGTMFWQHRLSATCLGRPLIVSVGPRRLAYVPTYDGLVHEVETAQGHVVGHFELGQPLTVGGVWQEGTDLLYFPGESDYLYVLDAALTNPPNRPPRPKQCVAILHTGHPSGSLRSEPILVNRIDPFAKAAGGPNPVPSYLILCQAEGLDRMNLRVFGLPIENPEAPPLLRPEPSIRGWSWLPPYHDGEKLAFVTDAGIFGFFGINQVRNDDKPLFPQLRAEQKLGQAGRLGRAQVVHVAENDFWVLANGELQRLHFDLFGQRLTPVWTAALPLGWPVHAGQLDESEKTIFVVTQDLAGQICLATAVDAEEGTVKWQRQLGLVCQGDPLVLGRHVVTVDRGGGLFIFDGSRYRHQDGREWRRSEPLNAPALKGGPVAAHLLPGPDGASVYEIVCPSSGGALTVRRYQPGQAGQKPVLDEQSAAESKLPPLAGTPAIVGPSLLLPLADGTIRRFPLPLTEGPGGGGPNWRLSRADDGARGHVVALSADEFLTTDGSRGLTHWRWPQNDQTFQTLPKNKVPTVELPARIVAAPVVLARAEGNAELQVCVADAEGTLTLLRGSPLRPDRTWSLGGKITAGPFLRGQYVGCVVDRHRLVWIDPAKEGALWEYRMEKGEGIVGQPQLVGDLLVIADLSGRFVGLDPASGKAPGSGYALKASALPAATPVAFGADAAFVPLTDGTVFLLALKDLRDPLAALPPFGF